MKRKIAVFTATRAEYGLLYWLMKDIQASPVLELQVLVSGTHLSPEFGETWKDVVDDGFVIGAKVEMLLSSDTTVGVAKSMGLGMLGFADALTRLAPDVLVVLGDRFEALAMVQTATVMRIPVAHLHGGEITEGAYDDAFRHAISKLSYLHFVAAEPYRQRVVQMGETPERVFNVGAFGLDHMLRTSRMSRQELSESLNFALDKPFFVVTYHPETAFQSDSALEFQELLAALDSFPEHQVILTYPNADNGGRAIIPLLEAYAAADPKRVLAIPSLGFKRYLSAVALSSAVIGNSSSGIIEVPAFGIPSVNIGARQQGRLAADSVLHCKAQVNSIRDSIMMALDDVFAERCRDVFNPYGQGSASARTVAVLEQFGGATPKTFHDLV
ncbi:UDP-N-acetylglucosamine 2-epimerase [Pseudomonas sp. zfem001]|uniref:UDP-N-acetylglucosamine 2-epimerase n=1 Tax=Pseudomonas sp. zfem001 TaxID=3078196 RepID=UPI002927E3DA|nr:UDP-N-acetylglucosamine 2-epimerase [Pseudomonas sp. zfem001]MDU9410466.1 UDP-N-acetylglucosamine 2-epimerase [Pseudomonas sp. zfem001]